MIKIVAIIGLILTAIILIFSHYHTGTDTVSVTNITKGFEFFPNGLSNFFESFQMVMFAFVSMEFIGMTAAETDNPRPTLKKRLTKFQFGLSSLCWGTVGNYEYLPMARYSG